MLEIICALALPPAKKNGYDLLVKFIEAYKPGYSVVLVNKKEFLIGESVESTPVIYKGLRIWLTKSA